MSRTCKTPVYNHVWYQQNRAKIYPRSVERAKVFAVSCQVLQLTRCNNTLPCNNAMWITGIAWAHVEIHDWVFPRWPATSPTHALGYYFRVCGLKLLQNFGRFVQLLTKTRQLQQIAAGVIAYQHFPHLHFPLSSQPIRDGVELNCYAPPVGSGTPAFRLGSRIDPHRHRGVVKVHWRVPWVGGLFSWVVATFTL